MKSSLVAVAAALAMRRSEGQQIARQVAAELGEVRAFVDWFEPQIAEHRRKTIRVLAGVIDTVVSGDLKRVGSHPAATRQDCFEKAIRVDGLLRAAVPYFSRERRDTAALCL